MGSESFYAFSRFMVKTVAGPRVMALSAKSCATAQRVQWSGTDLLKGSVYAPFGPNGGWTWGNSGATLASTPPLNQHLRIFDKDYRPIAIASDPEGYNRNITWDQANRITGIKVPIGLTLPGITNASSLNQAFAYDQLDRLTTFNAGIANATTLATGMALLPNESFTYDGIGNRKTRTTQAPGTIGGTSTQSTSYVHGTTNHWLQSSTGQTPNTYTLDITGNTLTEANALAAMNPSTGQLNATTGTPITSALTYTYDAKNRLNKVQIGATTTDTVTYKINAMGQRVQKTGAGLYAYSTTATINTTTGQSPQSISLNFNTRYVHDEQGRLLGEYSPEGKLIAETIWFNDLPVATLRPKGSSNQLPLGITGTTSTTANNAGNNTTANKVNVDIYYVHPDHLGTPRVVTRSVAVNNATTGPNAINKAVWSANTDPFGTSLGNSAPNENPQLVSGTATQSQAATFKQNHRFPGQVFDGESGKHYNYFRDYDPSVGRYTESDPIGLRGGFSTFGYAGESPVRSIDPLGLMGFGGGAQPGPRQPELQTAPYSRPADCFRAGECRCATPECAAGLPPTRGDYRTNDEIDQGVCEMYCGWLWPGPLLPGTTIVSWIKWGAGQGSSMWGCTKICRKKAPNKCPPPSGSSFWDTMGYLYGWSPLE
jgi:RHS repeat-associated protein